MVKLAPILRRPCAHCPFRSDREGYLRKSRVREIIKSLLKGLSFSCHETTSKPKKHWKHCAGAAIFLEQQKRPNTLMQIAGRLGYYDPAKLSEKVPVFKSEKDMVDAQEE